MTRRSIPKQERAEARLLDPEVWDAPRTLTPSELFNHGGDGWRRSRCDLDDPEDER
jgi:hypothetical protein